MTLTLPRNAVLTTGSISDDQVLDPRKSMPDYRREIYDLLQYLDEEQDKIEKELAKFTSQPRRPPTQAEDVESEDEDDFVVVEDVNAASRKKQLLNQLRQLWRTRDALRKRAQQLNIRIDSLSYAKGAGLMPMDDLPHGTQGLDLAENGEDL